MIWPWTARQERERENAARAALRDSVGELHATVLRHGEVAHVAETLRNIRQENHFAAAIRNVYQGGSA